MEFAIGPREGMEYRYRLDKGEALLYSWKATAPVNVEFHAEPDGAPRGYAQTYEKADATDAGIRHADRAVSRHPWLVLGEHDGSADYGHADVGWFLQPLPRIPQRSADEEQDVLAARKVEAVCP